MKTLTASQRKIFIAIVLISIGLRIVVALFLGNRITEMPGIADQITYHTLAQRVMNGFGFTFDRAWWPATPAGEPTAHWSYLYTFYLLIAYKIFEVNPLVVRLIQAIIIGFLQPWLLFHITRTIFSTKAALFAAGWIAIYTYLIYYTAAIMTESWFITLVLAVFYYAIKLTQPDSTWTRYLTFGVLLAFTVLLRQAFLLFIPFLFLWLVWVKRKKTILSTLLNLSLTTMVILAFIVPFTVYNYQRFNKFVLLNTNAGFAFFWANNPVYGTQFKGILPEEMGNYLELLPIELKGLNEAELDSALLQRGLAYVVENPARYFLLSLSRFPVLFEFLPSHDSSLISNLSRLTSFTLALPFMLVGIYFSIRDIYRQKRILFDSPASLLLLFGVVYTAIHILTWSLVRYRLPIDALFLSFAGLTLARLQAHFFVEKIKMPEHAL